MDGPEGPFNHLYPVQSTIQMYKIIPSLLERSRLQVYSSSRFSIRFPLIQFGRPQHFESGAISKCSNEQKKMTIISTVLAWADL